MQKALFAGLLALGACTPAAPSDLTSSERPLGLSSVFGINIDLANPGGNASPEVLADASVGMARFTFKDSSLGPDPDPAAIEAYRQKIDALRARGIQTLLIVSYETLAGMPVMDTDRGHWDAYRARFTQRVSKIAQAYGNSVAAYEIWNEMDEPNNRPDYSPGVPPQRYGELLRDAFHAIKAHSTAQVITGGADSGDPGYLVAARDQVGWLYADGVGVHPYGQRPDPSWPSPSWGFGTLENLIKAYAAATDRPIWITEMGTEDETIQAEYLRRSFERIRGSLAGTVAKAIWFCWSDAMVSPFGIVDGAGQPKAAYWEFRGGAGVVTPGAADVIVSALRTSPEHPVPGEAVQLFARVKNLGAQTTGAHVGVAFHVDGQYFSWGAEGTLTAGQELDGYASVGTWIATEGAHTLTATADDVNRFVEADETNNSASRTMQIVAAAEPVGQPTIVKACFSVFTVAGDQAPTLRADLEVQVPQWAWTQPMGTGASSCDWYNPGESFRERFPELAGAWRVGIDVDGASSARISSGVDHPWRFGLLADGCGVPVEGNRGVPSTSGHYTITGFIKLAPGDEVDPAHYYAGVVQEQTAWVQDRVGCR